VIRDVVIDVLVLGIAVGILVGLSRAYRPILRAARRDLAGFPAALEVDRAQYLAEAEFLDGQARRVDRPVCRAQSGEDCRRRVPGLLRLLGAHRARLSAYRQAVH
jgi:hypothetical protein